jgi:NAD(P)-dependent dehydrogenase (short-subunit alcohol dehydrogenase family)
MSLDIFRLDGKTAWITGGAKGLGLQFAHALASVGANIVINSRHGDEAAAAAKAVADQHGVKSLGA